MRIVADQNIPFVEAAFAALGAVTVLPSSAIDAAAVRDADLLLVRSTVKVGEALLAGSRVRFVATATIGTDHLDVPWLSQHGIAWSAAPGSNASSVAQWFASALLSIAVKRQLELEGRTLGIVGVGAVGRRIEQVGAALGMRVLRNDPPRARTEGEAGFVSLDELVAESEILTLHVPLTPTGPDRTVHLVDEARLAALLPHAFVINSCRGPVVDGSALIAARKRGQVGAAILDVFEGEPNVPPSLIAGADLCTPHIAGHSLDGKAAGTVAVYEAACAFLGARGTFNVRRSLPPQPIGTISIDARELSDEAAALAVLRRFYRIEDDDAALRKISTLPDGDRGKAFQRYRDNYPVRRELCGVAVELSPPRPRALALLETLGASIRRY